MKTKRIWIWSLIFGIVTALILYVTLFSHLFSEPASTTEEKGKQVSQEETEEEGAKDSSSTYPGKRNFTNPIIEVSKGQLAISIKVDSEPGVVGYIEPGSYVDVISYTTTKDENTGKQYKTAVLLLQNKKVLASGKSSNSEAEALNYESVTLEVNAKEGVMLSLAAKSQDGFYLMLRNKKDKAVEDEVIQETREVFN